MNTYMREAERLVLGMDLVEKAILAARSAWLADEAEQNLTKFRKEAESLHDFWCTQLTKSMEQLSDLDIKQHALQLPNGLSYTNRRNGLTDAQVEQRQWQIERLSQQKSKVKAVIDDIREAITYLKTYLYPSQEGNALQVESDLPFASNFGAVAHVSPISPAMSLVNALLSTQGRYMEEYYLTGLPEGMTVEARIREMTADECWSLLEIAVHEVGFDESERSDVEELWGMYYNNNFQTVLETVKQYLLS